MRWYLEVLKKYAVFSGRARRREFWYFHLFNLLFALLFALLAGFIAGIIVVLAGVDETTALGITEGIVDLYLLVVLVPSIAVSVRRLHDTSKSGWLVLLGLIPFIGPLLLLVFYCEDSEPGTNKYGPNPKEA